MQLDRCEVGNPHQRGQVVAQNVVDVPLVAMTPDGYRLNPLGPMLGGILLEKKFFVDAAWIAFECEWTVFQVGNQHRRNPRVVVDDLPFRNARGRIQHLIKVGQLEVAAINFDDLLGRQGDWVVKNSG